MPKLILASQSPRRKALLSQMGYRFDVEIADIDETPKKQETPIQLVTRLAMEKALAVRAKSPQDIIGDTVVLAADTIVVSQLCILGKPTGFDDFQAMMRMLSGATHQVMTAIAAASQQQQEVQQVTTEVTFCDLNEEDINAYWATQEPIDKAGGYGIQGIGGQFVSKINGSYSAVVGLPMVETRELLSRFGVER